MDLKFGPFKEWRETPKEGRPFSTFFGLFLGLLPFYTLQALPLVDLRLAYGPARESSAARAPKCPHIPWTPPDGGVLAEQRKTRGSGVE